MIQESASHKATIRCFVQVRILKSSSAHQPSTTFKQLFGNFRQNYTSTDSLLRRHRDQVLKLR